MIKIASLSDWGIDNLGAVLTKHSSRGLVGEDARRLQKIAGEQFAHLVKNFEMPANLEPVYASALAATESHGYNRNGDGYSQDMLTKCASTFVTHGRNYRHHKAKDPAKSYGILKIAMYDPRMGIVHTLSGLFKDAEAARENGGGNVATEELEALAKEGSYPVSQGVSVLGGDKCVICEKVSTKREDYCTPKSQGGVCDLFGCRDGLSKIAEDGRHQALDNPRGIFHDLSKVTFPADRQAFAFALSPQDIEKAASGEVIPGMYGGAWKAEAVGAESSLLLPTDCSLSELELVKKASVLAQIESRVRQQLAEQEYQPSDYDYGLISPGDTTGLSKCASAASPRMAAAAQTCVSFGVRVPPIAFFKSAGLCAGDVAAATSASVELFQDLVKSPERLRQIAKQAAYESLHLPVNAAHAEEARKLSLDKLLISKRALEKLAEGAEVRVIRRPTKNLSVAASQALDKYAAYSLRVLAKLVLSDPDKVQLSIRQSNLY